MQDHVGAEGEFGERQADDDRRRASEAAHRRFRRPVTAIVTITLVTPTAEMPERFTAEILKFDEVQQCHAVTGDYDFFLLVQERSIEDYHAFAQRTFGSMQSVRAYKTTFVLRTFKNRNTLPDFCLAETE